MLREKHIFTLASYKQDDTLFTRLKSHLSSCPVWHPKGFQAYMLYMFPQCAAELMLKHHRLSGISNVIGLYQDRYLLLSVDFRDMERIGNDLIQIHKDKNISTIRKYCTDFMRESIKLNEKCSAIYFNLGNLDMEELRNLFSDLIDLALQVQSYAYITESLTLFDSENWAIRYLRQLYPGLTDNELDILFKPSDPSFVKRYRMRLLSAKSDASLKQVHKEFYWVKGSYYNLPKITVESLKQERTNILAVGKETVSKDMILNKYAEAKGLADFIKIIELFISMQDKRKENVLRLNYAIERIIRRVAELNKHWTIDDMLDMTPTELLQNMKKAPALNLRNIIRQRCRKSAWLFNEGCYTISTDASAINTISSLLVQAGDSLKGYPASKGKAIGIARIILSEKDFFKFKEGDILVTSMTRPEFALIMQKAKAFITNEGGLTCHAAIIAREMHKPCIIGTRNATKVLKDGDCIEVDADKGLVNKISQ